MAKYRQGMYKVVNKDKYKGNAEKVRFLSSYELAVFRFLDTHSSIIEWGAEEFIIPYFSSADGKKRRYMIDVYCKYKNRKGEIIQELIEIKPFCQTQPPINKTTKHKQVYLQELYTYSVNTDKWKAATKYAKERKMQFRILTEKDIFKNA